MPLKTLEGVWPTSSNRILMHGLSLTPNATKTVLQFYMGPVSFLKQVYRCLQWAAKCIDQWNPLKITAEQLLL